MIIRDAIQADTPSILRFIHALAEYEKLAHEVVASEESIRSTLFCAQPKSFAMIAEVGGKPVGFAVYFYNYSTFLGRHGLYVEDVFVDPGARGGGVGKALFAALAARAIEKNCGRMEWWVLDWNQPAIDFYANMGAQSMNEWTVYRLSGKPLADLADQNNQPQSAE
jgi:GNAT superfamily N-acetyltransferase